MKRQSISWEDSTHGVIEKKASVAADNGSPMGSFSAQTHAYVIAGLEVEEAAKSDPKAAEIWQRAQAIVSGTIARSMAGRGGNISAAKKAKNAERRSGEEHVRERKPETAVKKPDASADTKRTKKIK